MRRALPLALALACLPLHGCVAGAIYQRTIAPLDLNLRDTPAGSVDGEANLKDLNLTYVRIAWDGNDIAGAARKAGIARIHYADLEVLNVIGIWRQSWVHVHGEGAVPPAR
jgi:hypothetical protein